MLNICKVCYIFIKKKIQQVKLFGYVSMGLKRKFEFGDVMWICEFYVKEL